MSWGEVLFLKKVIDGKRSFAGSDTPIVVYLSSPSFGSLYNKITFGSFIPKSDGVIRLKAYGYRITTAPYWQQVRLYDGDTVVGAVSGFGTNVDGADWKYVDISIEKGKEYTIKADGVYLKHIQICASIVDGSMFQYNVR